MAELALQGLESAEEGAFWTPRWVHHQDRLGLEDERERMEALISRVGVEIAQLLGSSLENDRVYAQLESLLAPLEARRAILVNRLLEVRLELAID